MKRVPVIFLTLLLFAVSAFSRPAYQGTALVKQPDGTYVTIRLVGDEYRSYNTTADGYTLTRDDRGFYVYASLDTDGQLAPTDLVAHDAGERTAADIAFLQRTGRVVPVMSSENEAMMRRDKAARAQALDRRRAALYDYNKFRGLIILVEFNDCQFRYDDYADIMYKMVNQDDYKGEARTNIGNDAKCTGSMRDYFRDNSNGAFLPTFDIVGPVQINRSQYYPRPDGNDRTNNYRQLFTDAVNAADPIVNFKDYDINSDGYVDMVYFIFAGLPSYISGNDGRLLWPHQSDLRYYGLRKDGVNLGRYACSTELFGTPDWNVLEGIGTMTHEFSHVLGLPDLYDTNNVNPDFCVTPGKWSVMANGNDGNYGRTPINYSLYERYALGFAKPEVITEPGELSLEAIHSSNSGYRLNTPVKKEFFLLENRQKVKWDAVLPGHGMLIFRVDSTNSSAWTNNTVNDNPKHPYYELVRAKGAAAPTEYDESPSTARDPFPGTGRVTAISNDTEPANLLTWVGKRNEFGLRKITEHNGVISFEAYLANVLTDIELPDSITLVYGTTMQLQPVLTPENATATLVWSSSNNSVATVSNDGLVTAVSEGTATIILTGNGTITATCHVTVKQIDTMPDIASFKTMEDGSRAQLALNDAQVVFTNGSDTFIRDSSGAIKMGVDELKTDIGDMLNGTIFGQLDLINTMPQLTSVENSTTLTGIDIKPATEAPRPRDVKHTDSLTYDLLCDLVTLKAVTLVLENKMVFALVGSQKARMFNTFKLKNISTPKTTALAGKYFDVTGILTTDIINGELAYVISLTNSVVQVEKPAEEIEGDVNGDGTVNVADISAIIGVMSGSEHYDNADVNGDGNVDVADISYIIGIMAAQ